MRELIGRNPSAPGGRWNEYRLPAGCSPSDEHREFDADPDAKKNEGKLNRRA